MGIKAVLLGEITKLKIQAFDDVNCTKPKKEHKYGLDDLKFEALLNPTTSTESTTLEHDATQAVGDTGASISFNKISPRNYSLELMLDGTGVAVNDKIPFTGAIHLKPKNDVAEQVARLKAVVLSYDGEVHSSPYVKIIWGTDLFKGMLKEISINYTRFNPDGSPLRAVATMQFVESIEPSKMAAEKSNSSPDLTHVRTVKAGDTLPLMTYDIYGDASHYLAVARANQLKDYRNLEPGRKLFFPPLDKTQA